MNQPNPYDSPRESTEPAEPRPVRPRSGRSGADFFGAVLGSFAGVAFAVLCKWLPAEDLLWTAGKRAAFGLTRLGAGIAVALTILGSIAGGLYGRVLDRQANRRR